MLLLNVGSGQRPFKKPWINVDVQDRWIPDVVADGSSMPMFEDNSADMVVLHHVLEHSGCGESDSMLKECHRVLKPKGSLLIFVPDLRALAQRWITHQMSDQVYFTNLYGAYMGDEADRHRWGFSRDSLRSTLWAMERWSEVLDFNWRKIEGADIARDFWILGVEAIK